MAKKKVTETEEAPRRSKRSREPVEPAADASAKKSKNEPAKKGKGASKGGKKTGDEDEAAAALTAIKKVSGEYRTQFKFKSSVVLFSIIFIMAHHLVTFSS